MWYNSFVKLSASFQQFKNFDEVAKEIHEYFKKSHNQLEDLKKLMPLFLQLNFPQPNIKTFILKGPNFDVPVKLEFSDSIASWDAVEQYITLDVDANLNSDLETIKSRLAHEINHALEGMKGKGYVAFQKYLDPIGNDEKHPKTLMKRLQRDNPPNKQELERESYLAMRHELRARADQVYSKNKHILEDPEKLQKFKEDNKVKNNEDLIVALMNNTIPEDLLLIKPNAKRYIMEKLYQNIFETRKGFLDTYNINDKEIKRAVDKINEEYLEDLKLNPEDQLTALNNRYNKLKELYENTTDQRKELILPHINDTAKRINKFSEFGSKSVSLGFILTVDQFKHFFKPMYEKAKLLRNSSPGIEGKIDEYNFLIKSYTKIIEKNIKGLILPISPRAEQELSDLEEIYTFASKLRSNAIVERNKLIEEKYKKEKKPDQEINTSIQETTAKIHYLIKKKVLAKKTCKKIL